MSRWTQQSISKLTFFLSVRE